MKFLLLIFSLLTVFYSTTVTPTVSAHEVYVLNSEQINYGLTAPSISLVDVALKHQNQFLFWGLIGFLLVTVVFFTSISRTLERKFDPFLAKLPPFAPLVSRITIGLSFLAAAYYGALFGPELPLIKIFGPYTFIVTWILVICGAMFILGFYTRIAAVITLVLFAIEVYYNGLYMLTYTTYLGELLLLLILGAHTVAFHHKEHDKKKLPAWFLKFKQDFIPITFFLLRVSFGVSLIYASVYAKIIHNQLAIMVAGLPLAGHTTGLASVFGFSPDFLVLGAAIVEILIGTFMILGIEIRFTAIFMIFWLTLSLLYFGEVVWPHIILIGTPIAFIFYGYDKYSLEGYFFKKDGFEPVL